MKYLSALLVLGAYALTAFAAPQPATLSLILSRETGRFLSISEDGSIMANGSLSTSSHLHVMHLANNQITIQSVDADKPCYLIFENGSFMSGASDGSNSVLERVPVGAHSFALRVVNSETYQEGDRICYLGFSTMESEPRCYDSIEYAATRFRIISVGV